jgi:hypothetical protein
LWRNWWNEDWQVKPKYSEKTCPSTTLSTTNPTSLDPVLNPGHLGGKPATNRCNLSRDLSRCCDGLPAGRPGFDSQWVQHFCFLHHVQIGCGVYTASYRMSIGGCFPENKVNRGVRLTPHLYLVLRSRMVELYLYSPTRLHGLVLNYCGTGTTLPLT